MGAFALVSAGSPLERIVNRELSFRFGVDLIGKRLSGWMLLGSVCSSERHRATAAALAGYHEAEGEGSTLDGVKVREALEKWNAGPAA